MATKRAIRWGGYRVLGEDGKELPEYAEMHKYSL
jgi:hypothetical protein